MEHYIFRLQKVNYLQVRKIQKTIPFRQTPQITITTSPHAQCKIEVETIGSNEKVQAM